MLSQNFITGVQLAAAPPKDNYIAALPAVRHLGNRRFTKPVTFFVGENGTGKSTLLEALAVSCGLNAEGGGRNFNFASRATHSDLWQYLTVRRGAVRPKDTFFLRAESFYNLASEVERLENDGPPGLLDYYGGKSLHEQSHGESFLALALNRFSAGGLYFLDEPEAALSPTRQLSLLCLLHQLSVQGAQLFVATHSPLLMACPGAEVLLFDHDGIRPTDYRHTEHYEVTRRFLNDPEGMLRQLLENF